MDYVTKTHKTKDGIEIKTEYCIKADFVPEEIGQISPEFIENYCVAHKQTAWFVEELSKTVVDKNGKERPASFMNLRKAFVDKFFPEIVKGNTVVSWRDQMLAKYKK